MKNYIGKLPDGVAFLVTGLSVYKIILVIS
jgi:hypothetical protein